MKKEYLYTPGPVTVPPEVLLKLAEPMYHHRTPRFKKMFGEVNAKLKTVEPMYHHRTPRFKKMFGEVNAKLKTVFRTENDIITFTSWRKMDSYR